MKFAYFVVPHVGGTHSVYRSVRTGLAAHGIEVSWLGVGPEALAVFNDPQWVAERAHGAAVGGNTNDEKSQAEALIAHLARERYDGVFVNASCNRVHSNVVRYLDTRIRR